MLTRFYNSYKRVYARKRGIGLSTHSHTNETKKSGKVMIHVYVYALSNSWKCVALAFLGVWQGQGHAYRSVAGAFMTCTASAAEHC